MATAEITLSGYTSRLDYLLTACANKKVLHLGCSSGRYIQARIERGSLLHDKLAGVVGSLHGVDIDKKSLDLMKSLGFRNLYFGNVEQLDKVNINETFDIVLAGDLLEHITRPGSMLDGIMGLLDKDGKVIISTNNAFGLNYQLRRWTGNFREHFEHVCFFSPETLLHLFDRHGFHVIEMYGAYTEPPYTTLNKIKYFFGSYLYRIFPVLAGTLIVVAKAKTNS